MRGHRRPPARHAHARPARRRSRCPTGARAHAEPITLAHRPPRRPGVARHRRPAHQAPDHRRGHGPEERIGLHARPARPRGSRGRPPPSRARGGRSPRRAPTSRRATCRRWSRGSRPRASRTEPSWATAWLAQRPAPVVVAVAQPEAGQVDGVGPSGRPAGRAAAPMWTPTCRCRAPAASGSPVPGLEHADPPSAGSASRRRRLPPPFTPHSARSLRSASSKARGSRRRRRRAAQGRCSWGPAWPTEVALSSAAYDPARWPARSPLRPGCWPPA